MSITFGEYTPRLVETLADARVFAELLCIVVLFIVVVELEAMRGRPNLWAVAGRTGLVAVSVPLSIVWILVVVERFAALLR